MQAVESIRIALFCWSRFSVFKRVAWLSMASVDSRPLEMEQPSETVKTRTPTQRIHDVQRQSRVEPGQLTSHLAVPCHPSHTPIIISIHATKSDSPSEIARSGSCRRRRQKEGHFFLWSCRDLFCSFD